MKICGSAIIILLVICPLCGSPLKRKSETIENFNERTGEATAVDHLIWEYEKEHQKLYNEEIRDGNVLQWPDLDDKNLSNYCKKYLKHSVPTRITDDAIGTKIEKKLHYMKKNTSWISKIVIVQCKIYLNYYKPRSYYITRAAQPDCVYAVNRTKDRKYSIINRHCKHIEWPQAMTHENLDIYCHQYMKECCPRRNRVGVTGTWQTEKFHYQKFNTNMDVSVTTIKCVTPGPTKVRYRMTRAPETNCVYTLLRKDGDAHDPLVIAFKHCDFEESKDHHTNLQNKEKRVEITTERHRQTGQPIAEDKYLLEYELEHQELLKREGKRIDWLQPKVHGNLDSYCYQYMREAVLNRNRLGVTGSWKIDKLHYRKMNTVDDIEVITVICKAHNTTKLNYYMTRAPQPNCVYALLRHGCNVYAPLVIVFKHCDFEDYQQEISKYYILSTNVSPKEEVKEETIDLHQTLQLFVKD